MARTGFWEDMGVRGGDPGRAEYSRRVGGCCGSCGDVEGQLRGEEEERGGTRDGGVERSGRKGDILRRRMEASQNCWMLDTPPDDLHNLQLRQAGAKRNSRLKSEFEARSSKLEGHGGVRRDASRRAIAPRWSPSPWAVGISRGGQRDRRQTAKGRIPSLRCFH